MEEGTKRDGKSRSTENNERKTTTKMIPRHVIMKVRPFLLVFPATT